MSALSPGRRLGSFEILSPLGTGGMGEVYRARDNRLGRDVAVKVLPTDVAQDGERLARFRREAHLLASLNHPHIAAVHGLEELDGKLLLVLELVEGEDLAQRLTRGAIPVDEALEVAKQIAEALEEAHEHGIVHRDLKPANIKLTPEGKAKVLDFGLAKAFAGDHVPSGNDTSHSPTLTRAGSESGVILGTAAYMSPEQARGKQVDKRSDIWAFGVVLFEMLTGKRLFHGETTSDTLAAILKTEPNWSLLPSDTPLRIRELLGRCLTRDSHARLRDIGDARIEIERVLAEPTASGLLPARPVPGLRWPAAVLVFAGVAIGALLARGLMSRTVAGPARDWYPKRFNLALPPGLGISDLEAENNALAISPDGRRVVFGKERSVALYLRDLDQLEPTHFQEGGADPFFSPDGRWVGFSRNARLWRKSLQGGEPSLICDAPWVMGESWGEDGTILFAPSNVGGLSRVSAAGGSPKVVVEPDKEKGEVSFRFPQILPGGKEAVFTVVSFAGEKTIALLSLESGKWRPLFKDGTRPRYVGGHLFFLRRGSLMAVPFTPPWSDPTTAPVPVLEDVWTNPVTGFAYLDISANGSLVYVPRRSDDPDTRLVWVDRSGNITPLSQKQLPYSGVALSPDATRLAAVVQGQKPGVWVGDIRRDAWTRLTDERAFGAVWTPDGKRLIFAAFRSGPSNAFWIPADGSGIAEQLTFGGGRQWPDFVAPDGKTLIYEALTTNGWDLMSLPLVGDRQPKPFIAGPADEQFGAISPDGRWMAYTSKESGEQSVYVRRFDGSGGRWRVAPSSGRSPIWARSGRELFYRDGDKMMVVGVKTEPEFNAQPPRVLFEVSTASPSFSPSFDVSPDGQRFVMIVSDQQQAMPPQLVVIPDWLDELKVKMQQAAH